MANKIAVYEGYDNHDFGGFGRHRRGKRHCKFGVAKRGRRKGQCLKHRRSRR
jgi:hypothetical protein